MAVDQKAQEADFLASLKTRSNPFKYTVAMPGLEDEVGSWTVAEWFASELQMMVKTVERYRTSANQPQGSQVYWITGEPGSGKTNLMWEFQRQILPFEQKYSRPTLIFQLGGSLLQKEPTDLLISEIYNRLVSREGAYVLKCLSVRMCATYLRKAIQAHPPHLQYTIANSLSLLDNSSRRMNRVNVFLEECDSKKVPEPGSILPRGRSDYRTLPTMLSNVSISTSAII